MTAPKDEQAEAFTLEDIIKEFGSAAQDPAELDTAAASQPTDEAAVDSISPAQPESAEPAEPVEEPSPADAIAEEVPDAPADAAPEAALEPTPAPTPEAPAKKPAKPEAPAPRPTRRQAAAMSAAEMGLIDDAELDAIIEEFGSKRPPRYSEQERLATLEQNLRSDLGSAPSMDFFEQQFRRVYGPDGPAHHAGHPGGNRFVLHLGICLGIADGTGPRTGGRPSGTAGRPGRDPSGKAEAPPRPELALRRAGRRRGGRRPGRRGSCPAAGKPGVSQSAGRPGRPGCAAHGRIGTGGSAGRKAGPPAAQTRYRPLPDLPTAPGRRGAGGKRCDRAAGKFGRRAGVRGGSSGRRALAPALPGQKESPPRAGADADGPRGLPALCQAPAAFGPVGEAGRGPSLPCPVFQRVLQPGLEFYRAAFADHVDRLVRQCFTGPQRSGLPGCHPHRHRKRKAQAI